MTKVPLVFVIPNPTKQGTETQAFYNIKDLVYMYGGMMEMLGVGDLVPPWSEVWPEICANKGKDKCEYEPSPVSNGFLTPCENFKPTIPVSRQVLEKIIKTVNRRRGWRAKDEIKYKDGYIIFIGYREVGNRFVMVFDKNGELVWENDFTPNQELCLLARGIILNF